MQYAFLLIYGTFMQRAFHLVNMYQYTHSVRIILVLYLPVS